MQLAVQLREEARLELDAMRQVYEAMLPKIPLAPQMPRCWGLSSHELAGRLDAAPYGPSRNTVQLGRFPECRTVLSKRFATHCRVPNAAN